MILAYIVINHSKWYHRATSGFPNGLFTFSQNCNFCSPQDVHLPTSFNILCNIFGQLSLNLEPFETLSLFILRDTTPEILGTWEKLEFAAMSTILLIVFKFSTSSTTNYVSVFPTELKGRSGYSPSCMCIDSDWVVVVTFSGLSMKTPFSSSCIYSCIYPHDFSLSFCYPSCYKYNKNLL